MPATPDLQRLMITGLHAMQAGQLDVAEQSFAEVLKHDTRPTPRILRAVMLPPVYRTSTELGQWRNRLLQRLAGLRDEGVRQDVTTDLAVPAFLPAYMGQSDVEVNRMLSGLNLMGADELDLVPKQRPPRPDNKIRVGFASAYLREHTIGRLNAGLIAKLPRDRFHVTVLSVGPPNDPMAHRIRESADGYGVIQPQNLPGMRRGIAGLNLDVLIYTDLQMEPVTYTLAHSRLAPVQCVTWGHPDTTGIRNLDYFLSSEHLDLPDAQKDYTEKLVRLPDLAVSFERPPKPPIVSRSEFGLPETATLYGCPQTLTKLHPDMDAAIASILRRDPAGRLVLLKGQYPTFQQTLTERFKESMPDVADRVVWVDRTDRAGFLRLNCCFDASLDPFPFGGGNTTWEALAMGVSVVTLPTTFLRGRISYALYKKMNFPDLIAADAKQYADLAVRLGTDKPFNRFARDQIRATSPAIFDSTDGVMQLAGWLESVAKR